MTEDELKNLFSLLCPQKSPAEQVFNLQMEQARRRTDESFRKMLELMQNREDVMREIADHLKKERQKQEN